MADEAKTYTQEQVEALVAERLVEERKGLEKSHRELLAETKKAKDALKNYDGLDPEKYKKLEAAAEEAERKKLAAEGDFESLKKQLVEKHGSEIGEKDKQIAKRQAALEKRLVQAELTAAIAKHKGDADLLLPHGSRFVKVREVENDFEAFVVDEAGNQRFADGKATPMSFDDLVTQVLIPKYPRAFDGTGSSGGGASKSSAGSAGGPRVIPAGDNAAAIANLEGIANGTVTIAG